MICPECGKETSNEQAFCLQCGAFVRSQFGKVLQTGPLQPVRAATTGPLIQRVEKESLEELDWVEIEALLLSADDEWPEEESVFIPNDEAGDATVAEDPEIDFEDAQADDLIEQSLSGQIKREDLISIAAEAEQPVSISTAEAKAVDGSIHETRPADAFHVGPTPVTLDDQFLKTNPDMSLAEIRAVPGVPIVESPPKRRRWLPTLATLIVPVVFFVGGVAVGMR